MQTHALERSGKTSSHRKGWGEASTALQSHSLTTFQSRSQRSCRSPEHFHNLKALIRAQANEGEEERVAAADLELRAIRGRKRTLSAVLSHNSGSAQRPMASENDQQSSKRARIEADMLLKDAHGPRTAQQSTQLLSVQRRADNLHEACTYCESKANEPDSPFYFQVSHDRGEGRSPRVSCRTLSTLGQTASGHPGARIARQEPIRLAPGACARAMACRTRGSNAVFHVLPLRLVGPSEGRMQEPSLSVVPASGECLSAGANFLLVWSEQRPAFYCGASVWIFLS
jgi:hypothetical protein